MIDKFFISLFLHIPMQNIQNQKNFCTFQQPSILSTHRLALRTMEGYSPSSSPSPCGTGCTSYDDMTCPANWTKYTQDLDNEYSLMCRSPTSIKGSTNSSICSLTPDKTYKKCPGGKKYCC